MVNEKIERYNLDKYDGFKVEQLGIIHTMVKKAKNELIPHDKLCANILVTNNITVLCDGIREAGSELDMGKKMLYVLASCSRNESNLYKDFNNALDACITEIKVIEFNALND